MGRSNLSAATLATLGREFFERDFLEVAAGLIGTTVVWGRCRGRVVEVEAYGAVDDPACHTAHRPSTREFLRRHPAGDGYIYLNYGMYWLLNVLATGGPGGDGIILIRALEPTAGLGLMRRRRKREAVGDSAPGRANSVSPWGSDGRITGAI